MLSDYIREKIIESVRKSQCYTVIADEVTDCSNTQQLCLALRYVNTDSYEIHEDLVSFLECDDDITGKALSEKSLHFLECHLDNISHHDT